MKNLFKIQTKDGTIHKTLKRPAMILDIWHVSILATGEINNMTNMFKGVKDAYDEMDKGDRVILFELPLDQGEIDRAYQDPMYAIELYNGSAGPIDGFTIGSLQDTVKSLRDKLKREKTENKRLNDKIIRLKNQSNTVIVKNGNNPFGEDSGDSPF